MACMKCDLSSVAMMHHRFLQHIGAGYRLSAATSLVGLCGIDTSKAAVGQAFSLPYVVYDSQGASAQVKIMHRCCNFATHTCSKALS
jgi:hypothetical protein